MRGGGGSSPQSGSRRTTTGRTPLWLRPCVAALAGVVLVGFSPGGEAASSDQAGEVRFVVVVQPPVVRLGQSAVVTVRSPARWLGLEVRLDGSTTAIGVLAPWFPLQPHDGVWSVTIPPLEMRGVYPLEFRERAGSKVTRSRRWLFRVLAVGTLARPSFPTPEEVARDWVKRHGTLRALRRWPLGTHDFRVRALHQRFVVAYSPVGYRNLADRRGIFITAVRISFGARWRLLEANVRP